MIFSCQLIIMDSSIIKMKPRANDKRREIPAVNFDDSLLEQGVVVFLIFLNGAG